MDDTNPQTTPSFNLDLNQTAQAGNPVNPQSANPLNTGNGAPQTSPTPPQPPVANQPPKDPYTVTPTSTPPQPPAKGKKIIIAVIVAVLFAAVGYGAYYFLKNSGTDESTNDTEETDLEAPPSIDIPTSEDSETSAKKKELEAVVEELKTIYADSPVVDSTDEETIIDFDDTPGPPVLSIDEPVEEDTEIETPSSGGVLR